MTTYAPLPRPRRPRTAHHRVSIAKPQGTHGWRVRYLDPGTGRVRAETIPHELSRTAASRREYASDVSQRLAREFDRLAAGGRRTSGLTLAEAMEGYFEAHASLRARTTIIYRTAAAKLVEAAAMVGVQLADDLTRAKLGECRTIIARQPKRTPLRDGRRGVYAASGEPRSANAINQDLRAVRTVLTYLVDHDALARLTLDDLRRSLKQEAVTRDPPDFLTPEEIAQMLQACLRHDAETYRETRAEHRGDAPKGGTRKYHPIGPYVVLLLTTGMRMSEGLALTFDRVDLTARNRDGNTVGRIIMRGDATKTRAGRPLDLSVSLALQVLLRRLHLEKGGKGSVCGLTLARVRRAFERLTNTYGAPERVTRQLLRSTCVTYLRGSDVMTPARAAQQLGHGEGVAVRRYDGGFTARRGAQTLDAAMEVEHLIDRIARGGVADTTVTPLRAADAG